MASGVPDENSLNTAFWSSTSTRIESALSCSWATRCACATYSLGAIIIMSGVALP